MTIALINIILYKLVKWRYEIMSGFSQHNNKELLQYVYRKTRMSNVDNITRTKAYQKYYQINPEIKWALLASIVSRNAGWNMTDLKTPLFNSFLSKRTIKQLFSTYERANWLIFSDAYPQLLIYSVSKLINQPMFDLLRHFDVSIFMIQEWYYFWKHKDKDRLMTALIINEQNVIQTPVTKHPFYQKHVFLKPPYLLQDFFQMNAVLLPTKSGIYGSYVHGFSNVTKRIELGKEIAGLLFHPHLFDPIYRFVIETEHTGSRRDYERRLKLPREPSPMLRAVYPIISHQDNIRNDWYFYGSIKTKWWKTSAITLDKNISKKFYRKRELLKAMYHIKNAATGKWL